MFQSSPVPTDGRYTVSMSMRFRSTEFQSSPVPTDGRYLMPAAVPNAAITVSILARPDGRALLDIIVPYS